MSADDNHCRAHMTPSARNICTCAVFSTSSFNFGLPTYFVSHYCHGRALHAVFYRTVFSKKSRSELFNSGVANDMSKVTDMFRGHRVDTMFLFRYVVQFALVLLTLSGLARDWCRFPSRRLPYTSFCLSIYFLISMFAFIPLFVDFVRYLTFWHHMIQI